MNDHTKAVIAHLTWIGWFISLIVNLTDKKTPLTSFYLRQMLGVALVFTLGWYVPLINWIICLAATLAWVYSLVGALQKRELLLPVVGEYFQEWFKGM